MENDKQNEIVYNPFTTEEFDYLLRQLEWKKEVCLLTERAEFLQSIIDKLKKMRMLEVGCQVRRSQQARAHKKEEK